MVYIKEIKFDNPNLYYEDRVSLGDTILKGVCGMWEITYIDSKDSKLWCGGLKTDLKLNEKYNYIFKPSFLKWLNSLHNNLKKGDKVEGYDDDKKYFKGVIVDKYQATNVKKHIWILADDGYTRSLNITTVKKI